MCSTLANLVVMVYFSHMLAPQDNGRYLGFMVNITIGSTIAGLGIGLLIFTYSQDELRYLIRSIRRHYYLLYFLFLAVIALAFAWLCETSLEGVLHTGYIPFLFFVAYASGILLESVLMVAKRFTLLLWGGGLYAVCFVGVSIWVYSGGFSLDRLLLGLLPVVFGKLLILLIATFRYLRQPAGQNMNDFKPRKTLTLWLHLGFYDLSNILIQWLDKFIVSLVLTAGTAAVYINGTVNIPFVPLALSAVSNATLMQLSYTAGRKDKAGLMLQAGRLLSCIAYPVFFFLLFFRAEFITVVFSEKYVEAIPIFLCSILILPVRAYSNTTILQNYHQGRIINIGVLLDYVVAIAIMYPLYLWLGLAGIALSFVISTYAQVIFYLYFSARLLGMPMWRLVPLKNWGMKLVCFGVLAFGLYQILSATLSPLYMLIAGSSVLGLVSLVLLKYEMKRE
jgi:O-antigen/teichoic acid export membrane protein